MFKSISPEDLPRLNSHLETRAYLAGFVPSQNDHIMYTHVRTMDVDPEMHHVLRWLSHMKSFSQAERAALPAKGKICDFAAAEEEVEEKPAAKKSSGGADLFGSDSESDDEETRAEKEKLQASLENKKKPKNAKAEMSMVVLEIKPNDDESDMEYVKNNLTKMVTMEGLNWGESEFQPLCYGLRALVVACTVVDDICSVDDLCEKIVEVFEDQVQSCDVRSFNKLG